ncbi:DENN domain-containing protein 5B [Sorochytrium milnesiophthora]
MPGNTFAMSSSSDNSTSTTTAYSGPAPLISHFIALELTVRENDEDYSIPPSDHASASGSTLLSSRSASLPLLKSTSEPIVRSSFVYPPTDENYVNNIHLFCIPFASSSTGRRTLPPSGDANSRYASLLSSSAHAALSAAATSTELPRVHDFVLTDDVGEQHLVSCLTVDSIHIADTDRRSSLSPLTISKSQPLGSSESTLFGAKSMQCFCLVSHHLRLDAMRTCLLEVARLAQSDQARGPETSTGLLENFIWSLLHDARFVLLPPPGPLTFKYRLPLSGKVLTFSPSRRDGNILPAVHFSMLPVLRTLSINTILDVFAALLLERSVLFYSTSLTLLHRASQTFIALLLPLRWDMVYVPLVPETLYEMVEAPTSFIMGAPTLWVHRYLTRRSKSRSNACPSSIVFVDIDNDMALFDLGVRLPILPRRHHLRCKLQQLLHQDYTSLDRPDTQTASVHHTDADTQMLVRQAFLAWFAEVAGGDMHVFFDLHGNMYPDKWLASAKPDDRPFLQLMWDTQMFSEFLLSRRPTGHRTPDYFDRFAESHLGTPSWFAHEPAPPVPTEQLSLVVDLTAKSSLPAPPKTLQRPPRKRDLCRFEPDRLESTDVPFESLLTQVERALREQPSMQLKWTRAKILELRMGSDCSTITLAVDCVKAYLALDLDDQSVLTDLQNVLSGLEPDARDAVLEQGLLPDALHAQLQAEQQSAQSQSTSVRNSITTVLDLGASASDYDAQFRATSTRAASDIITTGLVAALNIHDAGSPSPTSADEVVKRTDSGSATDDVAAETPPPATLLPTKQSRRSGNRSRPRTRQSSVAAVVPSLFNTRTVVLNDDNATITEEDGHDKLVMSEPAVPPALHPVELSQHLLTVMITLVKTISTLVKHPSTGQPAHFVLRDAEALQGLVDTVVYNDVKALTSGLRTADLSNLSFTERLCFFLNVRNLLLIQDYAENAPPVSLYQRLTRTGASYDIGGHTYSLNEITNGILRAELSTPSILGIPVIPLARFSSRDPRHKLRLETPLPLLNFVLTDGTLHSPRIVSYALDDLYVQLECEATEYIRAAFAIIPAKNTVVIPQYFSWYYRDFGRSPLDVMVWIHQHLPHSTVGTFLKSHSLVKFDFNIHRDPTTALTPRASRKLAYRVKGNYSVEFAFKFPA